MSSQRGISLVELVVACAIGVILLTVTLVYASPWIGRESMRSVANDVASYMQLARIQAVSRNRDCRFVVNTSTGMLEIWDSLGTSSTSDDQKLSQRSIPESVTFDRPDAGDVVTLDPAGGPGAYQVTLAPDGTAPSGTGAVYLAGGEAFGSVEIQAAGAVQIAYWNGGAWHAGF